MKNIASVPNTICVIIILINIYFYWDIHQNQSDMHTVGPGDAHGAIGPAMMIMLSMGITFVASGLLLLWTVLTAIARKTFFTPSTFIAIALLIAAFFSPLILIEIF
jgi:hypothetical protein